MDFELPKELGDYIVELDEFIEREIRPLEQADDNVRFFDHRREDARTDWDRGGLPNGDWEALLHEGLYVNLARPSATPAGMTLLRCSLSALHSEDQVGEILGMFAAAGRATGCIS